MPEYVWNIGFAISLLFTSSSCILIARRVFKSGIEHFSSRLLILSGIINTCLCGLLFISQGIYELIRISSSDPVHFSQFLIPLVFIAVPVRILLNYFLIQRKSVIQYNLELCTDDGINTKITTICKTMGISPPTILSSDIVDSPFVFGRRSSKAILAIPEQWLKTNSSHQHIQLLHELSHIRNHDVGFLAWSTACLRDLRLLFILLPAMIVYCYSFGYSYTIPSISLYLACSFILFVMLRYVIRKRESLADMTAAMLVKSVKVKDVITSQETYTAIPDMGSTQKTKPKFADKIQRWLSDKAMFSKKQKTWKAMLKVFNFFNLLHPTIPNRVNTINSQNAIAQQSSSSLTESFWAGISLGFLGVIIALSGNWLTTFIQIPEFAQIPQEDMDAARLSFYIYGMITPIPWGFMAIFLTLPAWASLKEPILSKVFLLSLLGRYGIALVGACVITPLILIAGTGNHETYILLTICLIWYVFIAMFGFALSIVAIFIWRIIRYLQSSHATVFKVAILSFSLFIIAVLGLISFGAVSINNGNIFDGINLVSSTIIGAVLVLVVTKGSRLSETEQYIILSTPLSIYRVEGNRFKLAIWLINSLFTTAILLLFTILTYIGIDIIFGKIFKNINSTPGILMTAVICCATLVLLECRSPKKVKESKKLKICKLTHCLKLFSKPLDYKAYKKIIASYDLETKDTKTRILNLTINEAYEVVSLILDDTSQSRTLNHVSKWILQCQAEGGFGLWPTSSPRLRSTYQAISILRDADLLDKCNADLHTSWIRMLQQPDGFFKGPWSKRDSWQDTFYAVKSLNMLGSTLGPEQVILCKNWCTSILANEGLESDRPDMIYYCFAALTALGKIDKEISKLVSDWISLKIEELLLTNISLDYENVHFAIMTYNLFDGHLNISSESVKLLTERIQMALSAELTDIHI